MKRDPEGKEKEIFFSLVKTSGRTILEVGCGQGYFSQILMAEPSLRAGSELPAELTIVDMNKNDLELAADSLAQYGSRVRVLHTSGESLLEIPDSSYDLIVFSYSLHHQASPAKSLSEASRVLKDNGEIVVVEPIHQGEYCQFLAPVHNEEKLLSLAASALHDFVCSNKIRHEYLVNWSFTNSAEVCLKLIRQYNPSLELLGNMLKRYSSEREITFKDSVAIWILKK